MGMSRGDVQMGVDMSGGYVKRDIPCDLPHDACNVIYHL